jgi:hypothetical protein
MSRKVLSSYFFFRVKSLKVRLSKSMFLPGQAIDFPDPGAGKPDYHEVSLIHGSSLQEDLGDVFL